jgi:hypothetical protein
MSRGPGIVQRRVLAAFEDEPDRWFMMTELAAIVWPGEATAGAIGDKHRASLCRALRTLPGVTLRRCRVTKGLCARPGWFQRVRAST